MSSDKMLVHAHLLVNVHSGKIDKVKEALKGVNVDFHNKYQDPLITVAANQGHLDIVKLLLERGADVNIKNKDGETALSIIAKNPTAYPEPFNTVYDYANHETRSHAEETALEAHIDLFQKAKGRPINFNNDHIKLHIGIGPKLDEPFKLPVKYGTVEEAKRGFKSILEAFHTYSKIQKYICKGDLISEDLYNAIDYNNIIIIYENTHTNELLGYLMLTYIGSDTISIDYICTNYRYKGIGKQLLNIVKDIAKINEISMIRLQSLNTAKTFYIHEGFDINRIYGKEIYMRYNVSKHTGGRSLRRQRKKRAMNHTKRR